MSSVHTLALRQCAAPCGLPARVAWAPGGPKGWIALFVAILMGLSTVVLGQSAPFRRGDADASSSVDLNDAVLTLRHLFLGGWSSECLDALDADDSGSLDVTDAVFSLRFALLGGAAPPDPGPFQPGADPTPDDLGCARYPAAPTCLKRLSPGFPEEPGPCEGAEVGDVRDATFPDRPRLLLSETTLLTPDNFKKVSGVNLPRGGGSCDVFLKCVPADDEGAAFIARATIHSPTRWSIENTPVYVFGPCGGGTPSVLIRGGVYHVWFREDAADRQEVSLVTSSDLVGWEYFPRVFRVSDGGWDSRILAGADVVERGGRLWMYYRGSRFENQMQSDIGLAVSDDGKRWARYSSEPVFRRSVSSWDCALVGDPHVVEHEGKLFMLYSGHDNLDLVKADSADTVGLGKRIGLAISSDGVHWRRCYDAPIVEHGCKADNPFALIETGLLRIWFRTTDEPSGAGGTIVYEEYTFDACALKAL